MARSGTSAVAGLFREAGFFLGSDDELMGPDDHNPRGYNENLRLYAENERILQDAGGSWFSPPDPDSLTGEDADRRLRSVIRELLAQAGGSPIVIKDPRVGVLAPVWGPIIDDYLHPVLVLRDPIEVAMSLASRDGTPVPLGLSGWEVHMIALLAALRGRPVTVVRYQTILDDPNSARAAVEEVARFVDPALLQRIDPARAVAALDPTLRRNRSVDEHSMSLTGSQLELWEFLDLLEPGTTCLAPPPRLLEPPAMAREAVRAESLRIAVVEEMRELRRRHDQLAMEVERGQCALADVETAAVSERERARAAQEELNERIRGLVEENQALLVDHSAAVQELQRVTAVLEAVTQSSSWRITKPLREARRLVRERRVES
jgi:hypothetical protein